MSNTTHQKFGGRRKGTPNKTTAELRQWVNAILSKNEKRLQKDLNSLEPGERVKAITALLNFALPKLQSMTIEDQTKAEVEALRALLKEAPDEAVEAIAQRLNELNGL